METFGELLARDRRSDDLALVTADGRERSYHQILTNAYKAGNTLRHLGVRRGVEVAVAPVPDLHPYLAFLGAGLLGAPVRFDPARGVEAGARAVVVPVAEERSYDLPPGSKLVAFGGPPDDPATTHWEKQLWSENPGVPAPDLEPGSSLLTAGDVTHSQGDLLAAAAEVAEVGGIRSGTRVVLRAPLSDPGAVVAGLLAPLVVGGTTVLADPDLPPEKAEARGDVAVVPRKADRNGDGPEADTAASDAPDSDVPEPERLTAPALPP